MIHSFTRGTLAVAALLLVAVGAQAQTYDIRSGLLSYYPFESSVTDDANFTNHFTAVNGPTLVTTEPAPRGSVVQFNGTSQYLRLDHGNDNSVNGYPIFRGNGYSITMWVKGAAQANKIIFAQGSSTSNNPLLMLQTGSTTANNAKFDMYLRADGAGVLLNHVVSSNVVFDNTWHHVAWVDNNGSAQLYIDGNLDPANFNYTRGGTFTLDRAALGALLRANASAFFAGMVDDFSLWERTLSQSEVQQIMANGIATPVPPLPPLLLTEPANVTKNYQDNATFSVTAVGTRPNNVLSYQWYLNDAAIIDATNRTYRVFKLTTNNSAENYKVVVTTGGGSSTSSNAVLQVLPDGPADVRNGIVSYWPMDGVTNNNGIYSTLDLYSRNDFVLTNMTEANVQPGQVGNSLLFDNLATTYGLRSGGTPAYNTNGYAIAMWVNADGTFQPDVRAYSESSMLDTDPLFTIGTGSLVGGVGTNGCKIYIRNDLNREILHRTSTRPVFDGTWHHIVWTDTNGIGKLYIDGVLDETDFTYSPAGSTLTLNVSSVGAVVRSNLLGNMIFGNLDEITAWTRPISFTEVHEVITGGIPLPLAATPPSVATEPVSTNVFSRADVALSVVVTGTAPFDYQWHKNGSPVSGATDALLLLPNIQVTDSGDYYVVISNSAGSTNSATATVNVTARPAPPTGLALDFNNRAETEHYTEPGFESFAFTSAAIFNPTTLLYGGVEVTVGGINGSGIDSRRRTTPVNTGDFTEGKLLQDFIYSTPTSGTNGLDITLKYLKSNQPYTVTIWSFDTSNTGDRLSDWYANDILVKDDYTFNGAVLPTNNAQYQFTFNVVSDANGTVRIQGRREAANTSTVAVFLNALKIHVPITRITKIERAGGTLQLTIETPDSAVAQTVEECGSLPAGSWTGVASVSTSVISSTSLRFEFPEPTGAARFYRITRAE